MTRASHKKAKVRYSKLIKRVENKIELKERREKRGNKK
jgi:hypothetical protein